MDWNFLCGLCMLCHDVSGLSGLSFSEVVSPSAMVEGHP